MRAVTDRAQGQNRAIAPGAKGGEAGRAAGQGSDHWG